MDEWKRRAKALFELLTRKQQERIAFAVNPDNEAMIDGLMSGTLKAVPVAASTIGNAIVEHAKTMRPVDPSLVKGVTTARRPASQPVRHVARTATSLASAPTQAPTAEDREKFMGKPGETGRPKK